MALWPAMAAGQGVDIVRSADSGYFIVVAADSIFADQVYVQGDTLSIDGQIRYNQEYTALRAGLSFMARWDLPRESVHVIGGNQFRLSVDMFYFHDEHIEMVTDTIWLPADTVFVPQDTLRVEVPGDTLYLPGDTLYVEAPVLDYESTLLHSVNVEHIQNQPAYHHVTYEWESVGQFNDISWRCIDQIPTEDDEYYWGRTDQEYVTFSQPESSHSYSFETDCNQYLHAFIWAQDVGWGVRKDEFLNLAFLDSLFRMNTGIGVVDGEWNDPTMWEMQPSWNDNSILYHLDEVLYHENTSSGSNLWIWQGTPASDRYQVYIEMDAGLHLRMFSSPDGHSQDITYYGGELRYARWQTGDPGNTSNYSEPFTVPLDMDTSQPIKYRVEIRTEYIRARAWQGDDEPDIWHIDSVPEGLLSGRVGIGGHSTAVRRISAFQVTHD